MIRIFHKTAEVFNRTISKRVAERNNAYISFSQEKDDYFLSIKQGESKQSFCATIGMATFYSVKRKEQLQEEIMLAKEFALKKLLYCKFAYAKKLYAEKQNYDSKLLIAILFGEEFKRFSRAQILKRKIQKLNKQSGLNQLMGKSDLQLSLF